MKRSLVLLIAALFAVTAPLSPARADVSVPIDFFYDALSPSGDWIYVENYGYVWQPLAARDPNWAPYADGYWAYTDAGWTWISNEDFGWITYHYGRWMRMQQNWVWVPGYEWAPAWVSWRQTQGQIGWAPLPPEAAWVSNIGFGAWTDSYYDVGPAYYNFVPMTAFATSTSLMPFIMDRNRNFSFYDQSVNITHINYQPNVPNHIFVGGPDPTRLDRMGSNPVRRLTLRHDDEGFRRDWQSQPGGPHRGMGNPSRIERDQFVIAAPSIRRDGPQGLPSRVREHMHQPMIDRGWHGASDNDRLRQQQREELARTRPQNLPEKSRQPATSMTPPPAVGRVLNPEERGSSGPGRDPHRMAEEVRPAVPLPSSNRPGTPGGITERPGNRGNTPHADMPRERRPGGLPGAKPDERAGEAPGIPAAKESPPAERPTPRLDPKTPDVPPAQAIPDQPGRRSGFPGNREQRPGPGRGPSPQPPAATPSVPPPAQSATPPESRGRPVPMPQRREPPQQPQARPMPAPQVPNPAAAMPAAPTRIAPPHSAPPQTAPPASRPAPQPQQQPQNPGAQGPGPGGPHGGPGGRHGKHP